MLKNYYSSGHFFSSGPKKDSTYAAQLVGYNIGLFIKNFLKNIRNKKFKNLCLLYKSNNSIKINNFLHGLYFNKIRFKLKENNLSIPHGYIRLRKQRCL